MSVELAATGLNEIANFRAPFSIKDGIKILVKTWSEARLSWSKAKSDSERNIYEGIQGLTYNAIQELRSRPLTDKLKPSFRNPTADDLSARRRLSGRTGQLTLAQILEYITLHPNEKAVKANRSKIRVISYTGKILLADSTEQEEVRMRRAEMRLVI